MDQLFAWVFLTLSAYFGEGCLSGELQAGFSGDLSSLASWPLPFWARDTSLWLCVSLCVPGRNTFTCGYWRGRGGWKKWWERSAGRQFISRSHWHENHHETPNCTWRSPGCGGSLNQDRHHDLMNKRRAFGGNKVLLVWLAPAVCDGGE